MARNKTNTRTLLFEELEPRLLFSADGAELLAAEAVEQQVEEAPVIIIEPGAEQLDTGVDTGADTDTAATDKGSHQTATSDSIETTDGSDTISDSTPSESESTAPETEENDAAVPSQSEDTSPEITESLTDTTELTTTENDTDSFVIAEEAVERRNELVLVNDNVRDIEQLVTGIGLADEGLGTIEVITLDTERGGIEQVGELLSTRDELDAIHIFSHGRDGYLSLGSDWLNSEDLLDNSETLGDWGDSLTEDGDILLYGCSIAADDTGRDFVETIAELTGADVSASDDPTGHAGLGGDWELEYATGVVESTTQIDSQTARDWNHLMAATIADDFDSWTYSGNTGTVTWNNDWQELIESDGAGHGNVQVYQHGGYGWETVLSIWKAPDGIWREANLSGASTATLSFDYGLYSVDAGDSVTLQISTDGGSIWSTIDTLSGPESHAVLQSASYDISAYIDSDTRIKFESSALFGDNDEFVLDNVLIDIDTQVLTVNTDADILDGDTSSTASLLSSPGGDGNISLREAIEAANNTPGRDIITFTIPGAGPHTITLDPALNGLPYITEAIFIDGASEPDYVDAPVIEIDGSALSAVGGDNYDAFRLDPGSDGSTISDLSITGFTDSSGWGQAFDIRSDDNVIAGNYIGITPDGTTADGNRIGVMLHNGAENNIIGGTSALDRNIISSNSEEGIHIQDDITTGNVIIGNFIGTDASGTLDRGNGWEGISIDDSDFNQIGGAFASSGNLISGNDRDGILIYNGGDNTTIQGNLIGTNVDGTSGIGNSGSGIHVVDDASDGTIIGGSAVGEGNLISGNSGHGINIEGADFAEIYGNKIGTNAAGTESLGNSGHGISIDLNSDYNEIGGTTAGTGNQIAYNGGSGVAIVDSNSVENTVLGNLIHTNGGLAIDLGADGVTLNDIADADLGANYLRNFPIITSVNQNGSDLEIDFNLELLAGDYRIEFYENPGGIDGSGYGEAERFLGAAQVTSNGVGSEHFQTVLTGVIAVDLNSLSATATSYLGGTNYGGTSEFGPTTDSIAILNPVKDTYLNSNTPDNNYGGSSTLIIDKTGGSFGNSRALLEFDLSTLPVGAEITGAVLQLNALSNDGAFKINVYEITQDWWEGTGGTGVADWIYRYSPENGSNEWTTAGGTIDSTQLASLTTADTGLHSWDVTSLVKDWYEGTKSNNGLMLASEDTGVDVTVTYESREGTVQPQLIITYSGGTPQPNTAPALDLTVDVALNSVMQDSGSPSGAVGTLIENLADLSGGGGLDNVTDPDVSPETGIALTFANGADGIWHYSLDDGANWNLVGSVDHNNALLLAADGQTRLYFEPNPGFNGTISGVITFKAWDQTFGVNGGTADSSPSGGTTAYSSATDSADITVVSIPQIKETLVPITIDGSVDGIWNTAQTYSIDQLASGTISNGADLSATFRTMWDANYVYTLVEVNDDVLTSDDTYDDDDFVAWFFDPDYSHTGSYDGVNDYHLGFHIFDEAQYHGIPSETDTTGLLYSINKTAGAYTLEIAMPWTTLGVTPLAGSLVGTEVKIADDDDGGAQDARLVWSDPADAAYSDPSAFGTMRLVANAAPTIGGDETGTVIEDDDPDLDDLLETSGTLTISDPDAGQSNFVAETVTGTYGNLDIDSTGNWSYSSDNTQLQIQQLGTGDTLTDTLTVSSVDGTTHDIILTVNGTNDLPNGSGSLTTTSLTDNDSDVNLFENISVSDLETESDLELKIILSDPTAGTLNGGGITDLGGGVYVGTGLTIAQADSSLDSIQFTPTSDTGSSGSFSTDFSVFVNDQESGDQLIVGPTTVTISRVNDTPTIGGTSSGSVTEDVDPDTDDLLETSGTLTISDPDAGDSSFVAETVSGTLGSLDIDSIGNWDYSVDNTLLAVQQLDDSESITDTITVTTADGTTHDLLITINGAEDSSIIGGTDTGDVSEDGVLLASGTLTISDIDSSDNPISFNDESGSGDNGYGTFSIISNQWSYTLSNGLAVVQALDAGQTVSDTYTFTASDGSTHQIVISIDGAEDPSVIGGVWVGSVSEDTSLTASNTLTITDPDTPDNPTFDDVTPTLGDNGFGDFEITGNTWTYMLNNSLAAVQALGAGQTLTDTYTFDASDGSSQEVTITINGNDDPSVIGGIANGTVSEDTSPTVSNTLTITDPDIPDNPSFTDVLPTLGDNGFGDFEITGNTWTYTLNNSLAAVQALGAGQTLTDTYTFDASDGSSQEVTITINGNDDPSVIGGIANGTVSEDTSPTVSNTLTITDPDIPDNPSFTDVLPTLGDNGFGDFEITGNTWTYTLNNSLAAVQALGAGQTLTDTYTFDASDGTSQLVAITINGNDDPSVIGGIANGTVSEDTSPTVSNTLTITDPDTPDNPSFTDVLPTLGDNGFGDFEITGNTWTYTLNNSLAAVQALGAGQTLTDTYTFDASDGSSQEVTITINGNDDPSVIGGIAIGTVSEDTSPTVSNTLTITDPDTPDNPSFTDVLPTLGDNGFGDFEITGNTWTYTLNNSLAAVQALGAGQTLTDTYTFDASDGSSQDVTITINGNDDPSVIGGIANGTVSEDTSPTVSNTLTITDPDTPDNPSFTDVLPTLGDNGFGDFEITGNTWTYTLNNSLAAVQALGAGQTLTDTYTFDASDGTSQLVTITINGTDDPSVIGGVSTGTVSEDGSLTASNTLTITDPDSSDSPSFDDVTPTLGDNGFGDFEITGNTWNYSLNNSLAAVQALGGGQTLTDTYTFDASDSTSQLVTITINGTDDPSVIGGVSTGTVSEDGSLSVSNTLTITDPDSSDSPSFDDVTPTLGDSGFGDFEITGNTWNYSLNNSHTAVQALGGGQTLTDTYTFDASDGTSQLVTITINGTDDPSVIGGVSTGTVSEDTSLTASNTLTITDPDTPDTPTFDDVTATIGDNGFGDFEITGNTWIYTLNNSHAAVQALGAGQTLTDTYTFDASDGTSQLVTITINGTDDPSVIGGISSGTVSEDGSLTASNTLTITDPDSSDSPSFDDVNPTLGDNGFGDFEITGNTWNYSLNNSHAAVQALGGGQTLTDTYTFDASDGTSQLVTITINGMNDTPLAADDSTNTAVNTSLTTGNVLLNDISGDGATAISSFDAVSSSGGAVIYNNDGTFTYTPAIDFTGDDTFTYSIADSDGEVSSATVTIAVNVPVTVDPDPVDPADPDPVTPDPVEPGEEPVVDETTDTEEPDTQTESSELTPSTDTIEEPSETAEPATADNDGDAKKSGDASNSRSNEDSESTVAQDPEIITRLEDGEIMPADLLMAEQSENTTVSASGRDTGELKIESLDSTSTTTLLLKRYLDHINFLDEMEYSTAINQLRDALDEFKGEAENEEQYYKTVIGSAIAVSTGLSVGYVVWLIRGGMLLSSMLFSMPAWQLADPLPLLAGGRDNDDEDEETLETMIRDSDANRGEKGKNKDNVENGDGS